MKGAVAHWLFKSEPSSWAWEQQVAAGQGGTGWSGVRNHLAKRHMMAMRLGDQGFFYHSNEGREVVGLVEVVQEYHPDATDPTGRFGLVDVRAVRALPRPVSLAAIKAEPTLRGMALVTQSRLSVQPVTPEEWAMICRMGGL